MNLLQDWLCMQGNGTTPRVQASRDWMDLGSLSDVTLWLDVKSVDNPGVGSVVLTYETAPTKDDTLFRAVATITLSTTSTPLVTKLRIADDPSVPLGRWLRWKLAATTAGDDWSVTFRLFAIAGRGVSVNSFDAASLALSGWWRASYVASPWIGSASTGSSGLRNLTEATNPPSTGTAVNGWVPANFDGTNDLLTTARPVTDFVTAGAGSIAALVNIDAISTAVPLGGTMFNNDAIVNDIGGYLGLVLGGASSNEAQAYIYDGAMKGAGVTVTLATWQFLQMRWDGTRVEIRLNSGSWNTTSCGSIQVPTYELRVGASAAGQLFDGKMLELMFADRYLGANDFDRLKGYVNARYALSL